MNSSQTSKHAELAVAKLVAKAWSDASFKTRLIQNTNEVLREAGLQIEAIVNTNGAAVPGLQLAANGGYEIALPAAPSSFSDEQLNWPAAGSPSCYCACDSCGSCSGCQSCGSCSGCACYC